MILLKCSANQGNKQELDKIINKISEDALQTL